MSVITIETVFHSQVESSVQASIASNKPLIVYLAPATSAEAQSDDSWINSLMGLNLLEQIRSSAIGLKLIENSQQFLLFKQIFPQVIVPSLFCVKVAKVLDVISGDVTTEAFAERLSRVLTADAAAPAAPAPAPESTPAVTPAPVTASTTAEHSGTASPPPTVPSYNHEPSPTTSTSHSSQTSTSTSTAPQTTTSAVSAPAPVPEHLPQVPVKTISSNPTRASTQPTKTLKEQIAEESIKRYQEDQQRKKRQEREDRERIKRLLKADEDERKAEAKRHAEERDRLRRLSNDHSIDESENNNNIEDILNESTGTLKENIRHHGKIPNSRPCSLSIRLLNGQVVKNDFKPSSTLNDVRQWVDTNRNDGDQPYAFHRTIPRVTYDITDEERTLEALELTPRCALILKPYQSYSNAYDGVTQGSGFLNRVYTGVSSWFAGSSSQPSSAAATSTSTASSSNRPSVLNNSSSSSANLNQYHDDPQLSNSPQLSSHYSSPVHSPSLLHTAVHSQQGSALNLAHPSALSLNLYSGNTAAAAAAATAPGARIGTPPLRPGTPSSMSNSRIRTLNDHRDLNDDRTVYNGNQLDLEDDKSNSKAVKKNVVNKKGGH